MKVDLEFKWNNISEELLDQLNLEWQSNNNVNAFLFARFIEQNPIFQKEIVCRGGPNVIDHVMKKSFYDRVCNKIMTCGHNHTGKKILAKRLLDSVLSSLSLKMNLSKTTILILCLVKSVPNGDIRRLKFGSGHLTKSVRLSIRKKISWFLKNLTDLIFKSRKTNFYTRVSEELSSIISNSPKSKLLSKKREVLSAVDKANIQ